MGLSGLRPIPSPSTTHMVGSAFWVTSWLFSVVNSNSEPTGSSMPAPTPRAYSRQSLESQLLSAGEPSAPNASGLMGMARLLGGR